jgi:hypothetical protein
MVWYPESFPDDPYDRDRVLAGHRNFVPPPPLVRPRRDVVLRRTWLGLKQSPDEPRHWEGIVEQIFRPQGIISVAAPIGTLLHDFSVGNRRIVPMGAAVPVETFTELDRVLGEQSPARPTFPPMEVGTPLSIRVTAPDGKSPLVWPTSFVIWGVVPDSF